MRVDQEHTPDSYKSIKVVAQFGVEGEEDLVKVTKCVTEDKEIYFHISHEPVDVKGPEDIKTVHSYRVIYSQPQELVRTNAIMTAERYYRREVCTI